MSKLKYFLIAGFLRIAGSLPLGLAQFIGKWLGLLAWKLRGRSRKVTDTNIRICLPELSSEQQRELSKASMAHTGMTAAEIPLMWEWPVEKCRSEEHTSELQSRENLVCRLLLEKKKKK